MNNEPNTNEPEKYEPGINEPGTSEGDNQERAGEDRAAAPARRWRRWPAYAGIITVVFLGLAAIGGGSAEYYTSQPQFCGSCHIMQPYYHSWQSDVHSGDAYAACVDCHYPPGEQHTLMAKFRGLSQVASYFSGRAGAGRPKAHVNDASCMRSGCHSNREFMTVELKLGDVTFVHAKHLDPDGAMLREKREQLEAHRSLLLERLEPSQVAELDALARTMGPQAQRETALTKWLESYQLAALREEVLAYAELVHVEVRIDQLEGLKCASCHQFDSTLADHFEVARTTCYTCHFINQPFNGGTGRCLTCHDPPTTLVPIHAGQHPATTREAPQVMMNHTTIVENNVNCVRCHADLIRGAGRVTRRDCQNCHDQERFLKDFDQRTTETVREYHRTHAAAQRARCNDCHEVIRHALEPLAQVDESRPLLAPVRDDCQHCHPGHHRVQVEFLLGQGGFIEGASGVPNPMISSRVNCRGCHVEPVLEGNMEAVIQATREACYDCHGEDYKQLFTKWRQNIDARKAEAETLLSRGRARLAEVRERSERPVDEAERLLGRARENIHLVQSASGMHNKNFAMMLLDQAVVDLEQALMILAE